MPHRLQGSSTLAVFDLHASPAMYPLDCCPEMARGATILAPGCDGLGTRLYVGIIRVYGRGSNPAVPTSKQLSRTHSGGVRQPGEGSLCAMDIC